MKSSKSHMVIAMSTPHRERPVEVASPHETIEEAAAAKGWAAAVGERRL